jgi:hypothetical protein
MRQHERSLNCKLFLTTEINFQIFPTADQLHNRTCTTWFKTCSIIYSETQIVPNLHIICSTRILFKRVTTVTTANTLSWGSLKFNFSYFKTRYLAKLMHSQWFTLSFTWQVWCEDTRLIWTSGLECQLLVFFTLFFTNYSTFNNICKENLSSMSCSTI